jgi:hypothetical protein
MLLDNGVIGFLCIVPIFFIAMKRSTGLFLDRNDAYYETAGGVALSLLLSLLIASFGAQTLYPREGVEGMWAAVGIAMRLSVERERRNSMPDDPEEQEFEEAPEVEVEPNFANTTQFAAS